MQKLEKILEEIDKATDDHGMVDYINGKPVIPKNQAKDIIRKYMDDGWVPVEERLPEEGDDVLVWYEYFRWNYNRMFQTYGIGYQYDGHWSGDVNGVKARCIAWRPLPEPYRPERSEDEQKKID